MPDVTLVKLRGYCQEMMIVWLIWEFAESLHDLRDLLRAWLAGSWVLASPDHRRISRLVGFGLRDRFASPPWGRIRTMWPDFSILGFPWPPCCWMAEQMARAVCWRWVTFRLGFACVLLTASRGGFLAAVVALTGCGDCCLCETASKGICGGAWRCQWCRGWTLVLRPARNARTNSIDCRSVAKW